MSQNVFYRTLTKIVNMASPADLTTTSRTASNFYARNWSRSPDLFRQEDLIGKAISGTLDPWPERMSFCNSGALISVNTY